MFKTVILYICLAVIAFGCGQGHPSDDAEKMLITPGLPSHGSLSGSYLVAFKDSSPGYSLASPKFSGSYHKRIVSNFASRDNLKLAVPLVSINLSGQPSLLDGSKSFS